MIEPWKRRDEAVFVDTNILFYGFDRDAGEKHERAKKVIGVLFETGTGSLSVQVLQELSVNLWANLPMKDKPPEIESILDPFLSWDVIVPGPGDVLRANRVKQRFGFSFWDSMIVQTARVADAGWLLTEDLQHEQTLGEDLTVYNPFKDLS